MTHFTKHKQKRDHGFTPTPQHGVMSRAFSKIKLFYKYLMAPKHSFGSVRRHKSTTPCLVSGFTLVELLVSFAIFSLVVTGSIGAMIAVINANRKAQALQLVTNNLNFALESMTRIIRLGHMYHCRSNLPGTPQTFATPSDCSGGGTYLGLESSQGNRSDDFDQVVFRYVGTRIERSIDSGQNWFRITAPEVLISNLEFTVIGTTPGDGEQPFVTITINGFAGTNQKTITEFRIQTSVSQRVLDF